MDVTELGIINDPVKPLQSPNAYSPMDVTEFGIVKAPLNPVQFLNA
jgi:hypothetical protein